MIKRLTDDPLPLSEARPDLRFPPNLQRVMDRALSRWPNDRFAAAAEFGRELQAVTGSVTGKVDVDAGTQVVKAGEIPVGAGTVPATRVDPSVREEIEKRKSQATQPASKARSPMVPIAAGVLVVALAGAAFSMKDRLFGAAPANVPASDTSVVAPDSSVAEADTVPAGSQTVPAGSVTESTRVSPDPGPRPPATTTNPPRDNPPPARVAVALPDLDAIIEPSTRVTARRSAEAIYRRTDVLDSLRAEAAALVGQAYYEDQDLDKAEEWFRTALRTFDRDLFRKLIDDVGRARARSGQN